MLGGMPKSKAKMTVKTKWKYPIKEIKSVNKRKATKRKKNIKGQNELTNW
jgi:hypothetical protein